MIKFNEIEVKFGDFTAIRNLSLEINRGEFFTFLGPSGCGKTTTLRSLVGFITPTKGTIEVNGEDITYKPIEKRKIGMVFQSYALFPTMTVKENIAFGLKENKWKKDDIEDRVNEVAIMVNLKDEQLKKNVSELSGGQQQRVAIARALALNPEIIVLDEPLSNLDAKLRKSLRKELKKIQKISGTTMIYVTHDQEEALALSDRIAVFNNGTIEQVGEPREIYNHPNSEFVTTFIGDTNVISKDVMKKINSKNSSCNIDTSCTAYVRKENITLSRLTQEPNSCVQLKASYQAEEFNGITTCRTFLMDGVELQSISSNNIEKLKKGQEVFLYIQLSDFIQFKENKE